MFDLHNWFLESKMKSNQLKINSTRVGVLKHFYKHIIRINYMSSYSCSLPLFVDLKLDFCLIIGAIENGICEAFGIVMLLRYF